MTGHLEHFQSPKAPHEYGLFIPAMTSFLRREGLLFPSLKCRFYRPQGAFCPFSLATTANQTASRGKMTPSGRKEAVTST